MAESLKGKSTAHVASCGDWRRAQVRNPEEMLPGALGALKCPFEIVPEQEDYIPSEYKTGTRYLRRGEHNAPWTGYYALYKGHKLAVANYASVWFKIHRRE